MFIWQGKSVGNPQNIIAARPSNPRVHKGGAQYGNRKKSFIPSSVSSRSTHTPWIWLCYHIYTFFFFRAFVLSHSVISRIERKYYFHSRPRPSVFQPRLTGAHAWKGSGVENVLLHIWHTELGVIVNGLNPGVSLVRIVWSSGWE